MVNSIQRVSIGTFVPEQFFRQYQKPGLPVIITGLFAGEREWDLDYLCEQLGNRELLFRFYGHERYQQDKRQWTSIGSGVGLKRLPFERYAQMLRSGEARDRDIYLAKYPLTETPLANSNALKTMGQRLGLNKPLTGLNIWAGPGGHVECLHYDPSDGTLIQLHGTKKVVLFPPEQTANLYPFPILSHLRHGLNLRCWFSQVYPEKPDFAAFPKLEQALQHKYEVYLNSGELLYIPAGWWHEVTALGDGMVCSVNRFWGISPRIRAISSWSKWRSILGSVCAAPYVVLKLVMALGGRDRKQKLSKILHQV